MTEQEKKELADLFEAMGQTDAKFQIGQVVGSQTNHIYLGDRVRQTAPKEAPGPEPTAPQLPKELNTEKGLALLAKLQGSDVLDAQMQPVDLSLGRMSILAYAMSKALWKQSRWAPFEALWGVKNLAQKYDSVKGSAKYFDTEKRRFLDLCK